MRERSTAENIAAFSQKVDVFQIGFGLVMFTAGIAPAAAIALIEWSMLTYAGAEVVKGSKEN